MILNLGAYATEIVRARLDATPRGQMDAAKAIGLNRLQMFCLVMLWPALAKMWPAMVSQIIIVKLGSAVCGHISTAKLSHAANLIQSRNFRACESFEPSLVYSFVALFCIVPCFPLLLLSKRLELTLYVSSR